MKDSIRREIISFLGFFISLVIFGAGYLAGLNGWWWAGILTVGVYFIVHKLVTV